jgi:hypothetical protein
MCAAGACTFSLAPAAGTLGQWTPFSRVWRVEVGGTLTVYLQQQSTTYSSYFAEVALQKEPTIGAWTLSPVEEWTAVRALLERRTFAGKSAIVVKDGGAWSHVYRQMEVYAALLGCRWLARQLRTGLSTMAWGKAALCREAGATYSLTGWMYLEAEGVCDADAAVVWCSPSVAVCPGAYQPTYYTTAGGRAWLCAADA